MQKEDFFVGRMEKKRVEDRFFRLYSQGGAVNAGCQIWVDRETGVQYLWHADGYGGGMTPLLAADGKPLLYKEKTVPEL